MSWTTELLVHAIAVRQFEVMGDVKKVRQFPLYNGRNCRGPFFRVLDPLPENGPATRRRILPRDRVRYLGFCLRYPSQWKTWIGLFPFIVLHYLCDPVQVLQPVDPARLRERPHDGLLYYERRGFLDWGTLQMAIDSASPQGARAQEPRAAAGPLAAPAGE